MSRKPKAEGFSINVNPGQTVTLWDYLKGDKGEAVQVISIMKTEVTADGKVKVYGRCIPS